MAFYLKWDSKVLLHGSIINFNEPYCAKVPIPGIGNLVELCVIFKDVEQVSEVMLSSVKKFVGCLID